VQVTDVRGSYAGWKLSLSTPAQFHKQGLNPVTTPEATDTTPGDYLSGAVLSFSGGHVNTINTVTSPASANTIPANVNSNAFILTPNNAQVTLVDAQINQGMGTWAYGFGKPTDYDATSAGSLTAIASKGPISLSVNTGTAKANVTYTADLVWTLSDTP
jgi:hypothetical protein